MAITYSSGIYTLQTSGVYNSADLYNYSSAGINRLNYSRPTFDIGANRIIVKTGAEFQLIPNKDIAGLWAGNPGWNDSTYLHTIDVQSGGIAFTDTQVDCPICAAYGIDQATALSYGSIFTPDFPNIQIDFQQAGTFNWGVDQFFVWCKAMGSTNADFQKNYNGMFLSTSTYGQLIIDTAVVDLFLDNPVAGSIAIQTNSNSNITGRPALTRDDEVSIEFPRTDGGKIILNPSINVVIATVSTSGDVVVTGDLADIENAITAAKNSIKGADNRDLTEVFDNTPSVDLGTMPADVTAIKSKTDNIPVNPASVSDIPTSQENADAVWNKTLP
jgi:hypothetical protein